MFPPLVISVNIVSDEFFPVEYSARWKMSCHSTCNLWCCREVNLP